MLPWKVFVRSVGAVTLLTMGGLTAGQAVVPFSQVSRSVDPQVVVEDETLPAADTGETPIVDDAAVVDGDAVATEVPDSGTPDVVDDGDGPAPADVPVVEVTDTPETAAPVTPTAAPEASTTAPVEGDADEKAARREERKVAREQRHDDGEKKNPAKSADKKNADKKNAEKNNAAKKSGEKGDHNCDGRPDNGWHNKPGYPVPCEDAARPKTAPGQVKKTERHREGRR